MQDHRAYGTPLPPRNEGPILPNGKSAAHGGPWGMLLGVAAIGFCVLALIWDPDAESSDQGQARAKEPAPRQPKPVATPDQKGQDEPDEVEPTEPVDPAACLDEVGCLLATEPPVCCERYSVQDPVPEEVVAEDSESLSVAQVQAGIAKIRSRVEACGDKHPASGIVKVNVKVSPKGKPESVSVDETPDDKLGTCVLSAVKRARFGKTTRGGSFNYPFQFE